MTSKKDCPFLSCVRQDEEWNWVSRTSRWRSKWLFVCADIHDIAFIPCNGLISYQLVQEIFFSRRMHEVKNQALSFTFPCRYPYREKKISWLNESIQSLILRFWKCSITTFVSASCAPEELDDPWCHIESNGGAGNFADARMRTSRDLDGALWRRMMGFMNDWLNWGLMEHASVGIIRVGVFRGRF